MKNILVKYEVISGEWSAYSVRSFRLERKEPIEVIHSFFSDFWKDETEIDTKGKIYYHSSWEQAVKIFNVIEVDDDEIKVFEKYGI